MNERRLCAFILFNAQMSPNDSVALNEPICVSQNASSVNNSIKIHARRSNNIRRIKRHRYPPARRSECQRQNEVGLRLSRWRKEDKTTWSVKPVSDSADMARKLNYIFIVCTRALCDCAKRTMRRDAHIDATAGILTKMSKFVIQITLRKRPERILHWFFACLCLSILTSTTFSFRRRCGWVAQRLRLLCPSRRTSEFNRIWRICSVNA